MNEFRMQHFGISVRDIDKTIEWYKKNFGFELTREFEKPDLEIRGALMKLGDFTLEILQPYFPEPFTAKDNSLITLLQKMGANHFAFSVNDIESTYRKLKENKVELVTELINKKMFFCKDPDGTLIEIRQQK